MFFPMSFVPYPENPAVLSTGINWSSMSYKISFLFISRMMAGLNFSCGDQTWMRRFLTCWKAEHEAV